MVAPSTPRHSATSTALPTLEASTDASTITRRNRSQSLTHVARSAPAPDAFEFEATLRGVTPYDIQAATTAMDQATFKQVRRQHWRRFGREQVIFGTLAIASAPITVPLTGGSFLGPYTAGQLGVLADRWATQHPMKVRGTLAAQASIVALDLAIGPYTSPALYGLAVGMADGLANEPRAMARGMLRLGERAVDTAKALVQRPAPDHLDTAFLLEDMDDGMSDAVPLEDAEWLLPEAAPTREAEQAGGGWVVVDLA